MNHRPRTTKHCHRKKEQVDVPASIVTGLNANTAKNLAASIAGLGFIFSCFSKKPSLLESNRLFLSVSFKNTSTATIEQ
jgi:hypothetical protein